MHLLLPDFDAPGWRAPRLVVAVGALLLLWRPSRVGFALCLVGTLWPLLLLRDVLTQSVYLAACAALGLVGARDTRAAVVWLTGGTYLLAAFHKLNTTFFDPTWSCADHAWAQVMARWPVPDLAPATPWLALGLEVALGVAVLRRSPWRWALAIVFHLPLTVTLAPAFGPVMLSELREIKGFGGLGVERDIYWQPMMLQEVIDGFDGTGHPKRPERPAEAV